MPLRRDRSAVFRWLQVALIICAFGLDFAHGIGLGQHDIGFQPIYRLRQSLAIAISRLRDPPLGHYLAYRSVVEGLSRHGFTIYPSDPGPSPDQDAWTALFRDPARMDQALQEAATTPIDPKRPPELLRINELAYVDYIYLAFHMFGIHMTSLYYLYFALLGLASTLFLVEFRRSGFCLFLLTSYLAGMFFLQNYVQSQDIQLGSLSNSRLFEALSLLPAMHIFLLVWRQAPLTLPRLAMAAAQSAMLALLIDCRITARWQIAMIVAAAAIVVIGRLRRRRAGEPMQARRQWKGAWAALIAFAALAAHMASISLTSDPRYATETEYHSVWHEVLCGVVGASPAIQRIYLGEDHGVSYQDADAYNSVSRDLNARQDKSSPIAYAEKGVIYLDTTRDNREYERLQRRMVFKIISEHPLLIAAGLYNKLVSQIDYYRANRAMAWTNVSIAAFITILGAVAWLGTQSRAAFPISIWRGALGLLLVLGCAMAPVIIQPSKLSVGTLLCFFVAPWVCAATLLLWISARASGRNAGGHVDLDRDTEDGARVLLAGDFRGARGARTEEARK